MGRYSYRLKLSGKGLERGEKVTVEGVNTGGGSSIVMNNLCKILFYRQCDPHYVLMMAQDLRKIIHTERSPDPKIEECSKLMLPPVNSTKTETKLFFSEKRQYTSPLPHNIS